MGIPSPCFHSRPKLDWNIRLRDGHFYNESEARRRKKERRVQKPRQSRNNESETEREREEEKWQAKIRALAGRHEY